MRSSLRAEILGHLGQAAETKFTSDGSPIVSFSVAYSPYVKQGEPERTIWIRVSYFGQRAEKVAQYLTRGTPVRVRGDLDVRDFTRKDGTPGYSVEIRCTELDLLGSKSDGNGEPAPQRPPVKTAFDDDSDMDEPF